MKSSNPMKKISSQKTVLEDAEDDDSKPIQHVSDLIGSWGPFQKRLFIILIFVYAISPFSNTSLIYYLTKSDFWCKDANGINVANDLNSCKIESCDDWFHNTTRINLVTEWDLVCDRSYLKSAAQSSYALGYLVSGLLIGTISDKYGRKIAVILSILVEIVCFFILATAKSIEIFIVARFISGIGGYGRYLGTLLILVETVGPELRGRIVVVYDWIWHIGIYVMILTTYYVENFRHLYLMVACYQVGSLILVIFKMPESLRWQLATGHDEIAHRTLSNYMSRNTPELEAKSQAKLEKLKQFLAQQHLQSSRSKGMIDIWRVPRLLGTCIALYFFWFALSFMGNGLSYFQLELSGNFHLNTAIIHLSNIAATAFLNWRVEKYDRTILLRLSSLGIVIFIFASAPFLLEHDVIYLRNMIFMLAQFALSVAFMIEYVYTAELFPTTMRHLALGSFSVPSRIGSIAAPFVSLLSAHMDKRFILVGFGSVGLIATVMTLFLPETRGQEMPDTVDDMIRMTREKSSKNDPTDSMDQS